MFSSPTPAPGSRAVASAALRSAGLMDRDAQMRDLTDKPGGRKGSSKIRAHRPRTIDPFKDLSGSAPRMLTSRLSSSQPGGSESLSIKGAARVTPMGRARRNAVPVTPESKASSIRVTTVPAIKQKSVALWKELLQRRWNPETRFLNLESDPIVTPRKCLQPFTTCPNCRYLQSMIDDELVKKHSLSPPGHGGDARVAAVIFKLAGQLSPKVQTLSLAKNNLSGIHLQPLSQYLPLLANLSLQDNRIRTWKDLDFISSRKGKLLHLRELVLLGNPIRETATLEGNQRFKQETAQRFPSLEVLDQEAITPILFDHPVTSSPSKADKQIENRVFPCEMGPSFVTGVDGTIVSNFLVRFFNALDTQRGSLLDAYHPSATFSYSVNTTIPTRARILGFHSSMPNQTKLSWGPWLSSGSRNLSRIAGHAERVVKSLHIGATDIVKTLAELPGTKHDISGPPEKFCLDSFPVVHGGDTGLLLTVHGQFTEVETEGIRSFDRSFILKAAPEGSRAKSNGWEVEIVSDQWMIRGYSSHEAWKPGPMLVQAVTRHQQQAIDIATVQAAFSQPQAPGSVPFDPQATLASMPESQRNLVMQIRQRTGLNVQFAIDCLGQNEWDLERSVANFEQVKTTLSRDAFT